MPRFHFVKENGVTRMVEVDNAEIAAIPLVQPGGATLQAGTPRQRWVCVACHPEKAFAGPGILSMHFGKYHKDLKKDKDSWRQYARTEEVNDGSDGPASS